MGNEEKRSADTFLSSFFNKTVDESRLAAFEKLANQPRVSRLASLILQHRKASQLQSKWIDADWLHKAKLSERKTCGAVQVRTSWNQTGTATGRLSASNPNLQAVTKYMVNLSDGNNSVDVNVRSAFIPSQK